jgi:hypothetical protein
MSVTCRCGWFIEALRVTTRTEAEIIADRHESADVRRPYRHETEIVELAA